MSRCLVTGAGGFVGSHLCEQLLAKGHEIIGIDGFIPYYPRQLKENNLQKIQENPRFIFHEIDLRAEPLEPYLSGVDVIFHLAAMAGLRRSWSEFDSYMTCNIQATQRLLEAAVSQKIGHFTQISTSSVYGRFATGDETSPLSPISPYGLTKLASENLCWAYAANYDLPVTVLRLYSVYGPRQRPDMGYNIFIHGILEDETLTIDGDGNDSRSNTFVTDCVEGIIAAFERPEQSIGETFNIGGGDEVNVNQVLAILAELTGKEPRITYGPPRAGDQKRTVANFDKARRLLDYNPVMTIREGLKAQLEWQMDL